VANCMRRAFAAPPCRSLPQPCRGSSAQVMEAPVHVASGPLGGVTTTTRALDGQVQHV
jgi:hypothetical protein